MLRPGQVTVGDLQPLGVARHLTVVRRADPLSSWATISISCLSTLVLLATGAAWLAPRSGWVSPILTPRVPPEISAEAPSPATFPSWVEVPHLTGPLSSRDEPDASSSADGPRTFLDPNPVITAEQPMSLPPRANPRLSLIGRAPLDAARLTNEQPPVWNERAERQDIATMVPPSAVATLEPDAPQPLQTRAETGTTRTRPADPTTTPTLPPGPAPMRLPTEVAVRPAPTITAVSPPGRVATLGPDPAQPVIDRTIPITPPSDAEGVVAPILNPGPARHARSLRRPRAGITASTLRAPFHDPKQAAGLISSPTTTRPRIDAVAVAYASMHRARADRSATPPATSAPSSPWTMPSALAPTD